MHLDLSTLQIPYVSVVPEPTEELITATLSLAATAAKEQGHSAMTQVLFSLARRCRELEADVARKEREINELYGVIAELKGERHGD